MITTLYNDYTWKTIPYIPTVRMKLRHCKQEHRPVVKRVSRKPVEKVSFKVKHSSWYQPKFYKRMFQILDRKRVCHYW